MRAVFFDLETTSLSRLGQVLQYSFFVTDHDYIPIKECSGQIALSPIELPDPGAILATGIPVLAHQRAGHPAEYEAARKIADFLRAECEACRACREPSYLMGYNAAGFDIPFLQTVFIRNGIDFNLTTQLVARDLLHSVQKLAVSQPTFYRFARGGANGSKLSLSLEHTAKGMGLLNGDQAHSAREDVALTILVAQEIKRRFGHDPLTFKAFEPELPFGRPARPLIVNRLEPNYAVHRGQGAHRFIPLSDAGKETPYLLVESRGDKSLWLNLKRFAASPVQDDVAMREALQYMHHAKKSFFMGSEPSAELREGALAARAWELCAHETLDGYFSRLPKRDIEERLFFMPAEGSADRAELRTRFELRRHGSERDPEAFRRYCESRYGEDFHSTGEDAGERRSLAAMCKELDVLIGAAAPADREALLELRQLYHDSPVAEALGITIQIEALRSFPDLGCFEPYQRETLRRPEMPR